MTEKHYPYEAGDITVLGPECFVARDGAVICWRGENYTPQRPTLRVRLHNLIVRLRSREERAE
jgi:hypothetical protein